MNDARKTRLLQKRDVDYMSFQSCWDINAVDSGLESLGRESLDGHMARGYRNAIP